VLEILADHPLLGLMLGAFFLYVFYKAALQMVSQSGEAVLTLRLAVGSFAVGLLALIPALGCFMGWWQLSYCKVDSAFSLLSAIFFLSSFSALLPVLAYVWRGRKALRLEGLQSRLWRGNLCIGVAVSTLAIFFFSGLVASLSYVSDQFHSPIAGSILDKIFGL
jgi:hypothetical protein